MSSSLGFTVPRRVRYAAYTAVLAYGAVCAGVGFAIGYLL